MRTLTGTYANGVTLTNLSDDPVGVGAFAGISQPANDAAALLCGYQPGHAFYWQVTNYGRISATGSNSAGVLIRAGGSVANAGYIGSTAGPGIWIQNGYGNVTNLGQIDSEDNGGAGILLTGGGNVTNGSSTDTRATIAGAIIDMYGHLHTSDGVRIVNAPGTVTNYAQIDGGQNGVSLQGGGRVTNLGSIVGFADAVQLFAPAAVASTLTNHGLIETGGGAGKADIQSMGSTTITNFGTVRIAEYGVYLGAGGTIVNENPGGAYSGGIYDVNVGIDGVSGIAVVTNPGTIDGTINGVSLVSGTVSNSGVIAATGTAGLGIRMTGTLGSTIKNSGTIAGAGGTAIAFGAGDDRLIVGPGAVFTGVVTGGLGANEIDFDKTGALSLDPEYVGFSEVRLGNGGLHSLSLSDADFAGIPGNTITVDGGNGTNAVYAGALAADHRLSYIGTIGADKVAGGAAPDTFSFAAAALTAIDSITGGGGSDTLVLTTGGTAVASGVSGVETFRLAGADADTLALSDTNFTGVAGGVITILGGAAGNTVNAAALGAAHRIVFVGGAGADNVTGGAGDDTFSSAAAALTAGDAVTAALAATSSF